MLSGKQLDATSAFEDAWRRRFENYGASHDDDASIAGWSSSGLDARLRHFKRAWPTDAPCGDWLDAGCGAGTYSRFLAERKMSVVAIDYSWPSTRKARDRSQLDIRWATADVTALPLRTNSLDGVLCLGVMQALASPEPALTELVRVLRPGGIVWVDALNARCFPSALEILWRRLKDQPPRLRHDQPRRLIALLQSIGFRDVRCHFVPILPGKLDRLQSVAEARFVHRLLAAAPTLAQLVSHAFLLTGQKR